MTDDLAPGLHIPPVPAEPDPSIVAAEKTLEERVATLEKDIAAIAADLGPVTSFLTTRGSSLETLVKHLSARVLGWF